MKRDTEYIFGYPPLSQAIEPEKIWDEDVPGREVALYIHIPFCRGFCHYCPFIKYPWDGAEVEAYLRAVKREICLAAQKPAMRHARVTAGFLGGGTPTSFDSRQLSELLDHCRIHLNVSPDAEITVEANPATVDREMLKALHDTGVNRICFGVQSFDDRVLSMLGCRHRGEQAIRAVNEAFDVGFHNVGLDLLFRLPGQKAKAWGQALETAVNLNVTHIAIPELSIDPGTPLYRSQMEGALPPLPGESEAVALYAFGRRILIDAGYNHYNLGYDFALPGRECLYHRMSWEAPQREVAGFGAGAYAYVNGVAYQNTPSLADYHRYLQRGGLPVLLGKKLSPSELMARFMVHGVFMVRVSKLRFKEAFNREMDEVYGDTLGRLAALNWIENGQDEIRLTAQGVVFVNNVSKSFYVEKYSGGIH